MFLWLLSLVGLFSENRLEIRVKGLGFRGSSYSILGTVIAQKKIPLILRLVTGTQESGLLSRNWRVWGLGIMEN